MKACLLFLCFALAAVAASPIRVALVAGDPGADTAGMLDLGAALVDPAQGIELLDRSEVDRILHEQEISLSARFSFAERAIRAGQLLGADLFVVLEKATSIMVYDAHNGIRYVDMSLAATNALSAGRQVTAAIKQAVNKCRLGSRAGLRAIGFLSVRNVDLPRSFDPLCDGIALMIEREIINASSIVILERRRLEHVNRERLLAGDGHEGLWPSLCLIDLHFFREASGMRAEFTVTDFAGRPIGSTNLSLPALEAAALASKAAVALAHLLKAEVPAVRPDLRIEARRFGREGDLLVAHKEYAAAARMFEAAHALDSSDSDFLYRLLKALPDAAIELLDPGAQHWHRPIKRMPSPDQIATALALGNRGADLCRDCWLNAAAAQSAKSPGSSSYEELWRLMEKFGDRTLRGTSLQPDIQSFAAKERALRIEIIEPWYRAAVHDRKSFDEYSWATFWFSFNDHLGSFDPPQWQRDSALVTLRWLKVASKWNPADGSGNYAPLARATSGAIMGSGVQAPGAFEPVWTECENAADPVLRAYGQFGRAMGKLKASNDRIADERALRSKLQEQIVAEAAHPKVRSKLFSMMDDALGAINNAKGDGLEYWSACQFALKQQEARPLLFNTSLVIMSAPRNNLKSELYLLADGILKLIADHPESFSERDRNQTGAMCRQFRDRYAPSSPPAHAPAPWTGVAKLFEASPVGNHVGWLFNPVVSGKDVYFAALSLGNSSATGEAIQVMRVSLDGTETATTPRLPFPRFIAENMWRSIDSAWRRGATVASMQLRDTPRAACISSTNYLLGTHLGLFIFPIDGSSPSLLSSSNGLPCDEVYSVAALRGRIYVGAGEFQRTAYLCEYDPAANRVRTLASSRGKPGSSPFAGQAPFVPSFLWADEAHDRILMLAAMERSNALTGLWSCSPQTGEFQQLAAFKLRSLQSRSVWAGLVAPGKLGVFNSFGYRIWDTRTERFDLQYEHNNETQQESPLWPARHEGGLSILQPPFLFRDHDIWWANPFQRVSLDGKRNEFPALRPWTEFDHLTSLRFLDAHRLLAADRSTLWLLNFPVQATSQASATSPIHH